MKLRNFAIATLGVCAATGVGSLIIDQPTNSNIRGATVESVASLNPLTGLRPIDEIVSFWADRSERNPSDYLSRTQLGAAQSAQARETATLVGYEDAEATLREALTLNPKYVPAQLSLASALSSQHQFDEAFQLADTVYRSNEASLSALAVRGDALFDLGHYQEAAVDFETLVEAERSAPTISRLARLASVNGAIDRSVAIAAEAIQLAERVPSRPNSAAFYWFQLGHYQFVAGDVDGAIDSLEQALIIDPSHPAATEELAIVNASAGNDTAAMALLAHLTAKPTAPDVHGLYAELLVRNGRAAEATEQEALAKSEAELYLGRFPAERRHLAEFFMKRDSELAVGIAAADIAERQDIGAYDTLAWAQFNNGQLSDAQFNVDQARATGIQDARILYHAAAIAAANGDTGPARELLDLALDRNPNFHPTEKFEAAELDQLLG